MFSFLPAKLSVSNGIVTISNISKKTIHRDFKRVFETSRVNKYLFQESGYNNIKFNEFFALELYYMLDIVKNAAYLGTSIRKLEQIQELLMTETWLSGINKKYPSILDKRKLELFKFKLLQHQSDFISYYDNTVPRYDLKGMLLAAAPGSGKTLTSLALAECLRSDIIIVICPKVALDTVWLKSTRGPDSLYKKDSTTWACNGREPYKRERIVMFNYEALDKALAMVNRFKGLKVTIILDESHNLNEIKSLRTQLFIELCNETKSKNVILATGTPIKALGVETVPLLSAIDPLFTEEVKALFVKLYAGEATKLSEILTRRLNVVSFKVSKEVLKLDEPIIEDILVKIPDGDKYTLTSISKDMIEYVKARTEEINKIRPEAIAFFNKMLADVTALSNNKIIYSKKHIDEFNDRMFRYKSSLNAVVYAYKQGNLATVNTEMAYCNAFEKNVIIPLIVNKADRERFKDVKSIVKYPKLKIKGECLGRVLGKKRVEAHLSMVKSIEFDDFIESTKKKTVIFTSYVEVVEAVDAVLKKEGYDPLKVHGEFTGELKSIVNRFEKDASINPLIATYASLSTAVPLTMADTMVVINPPYRDYIMKQTIARIHRIGANSQTRIFNILLDTGEEKNISSRGFDIIQWSKEQSEAILDLKTSDNVPDEETVSLESYIVDLKQSNTGRSILSVW
jgi:hypothetical protein